MDYNLKLQELAVKESGIITVKAAEEIGIRKDRRLCAELDPIHPAGCILCATCRAHTPQHKGEGNLKIQLCLHFVTKSAKRIDFSEEWLYTLSKQHRDDGSIRTGGNDYGLFRKSFQRTET